MIVGKDRIDRIEFFISREILKSLIFFYNIYIYMASAGGSEQITEEDLTSTILSGKPGEFVTWCVVNGIWDKLKRPHALIHDYKLSVILIKRVNEFDVKIKGPGDNDPYAQDDDVHFSFNRSSDAVWEFNISIDDIDIKLGDGRVIKLNGQGFARYLPTLMFYLHFRGIGAVTPGETTLMGSTRNPYIWHIDFTRPYLRIGIDADASKGFWDEMGLKIGPFCIDWTGQQGPIDWDGVKTFEGYDIFLLDKEFIGSADTETMKQFIFTSQIELRDYFLKNVHALEDWWLWIVKHRKDSTGGKRSKSKQRKSKRKSKRKSGLIKKINYRSKNKQGNPNTKRFRRRRIKN